MVAEVTEDRRRRHQDLGRNGSDGFSSPVGPMANDDVALKRPTTALAGVSRHSRWRGPVRPSERLIRVKSFVAHHTASASQAPEARARKRPAAPVRQRLASPPTAPNHVQLTMHHARPRLGPGKSI